MNKRIYDLCIQAGTSYDGVVYSINFKNELEKLNLSTLIFLMNDAYEKILKNHGISDYIILPVNNENIDILQAVEIAGNLGFSNIRTLYESEKYFYNYSESFCQNKISQILHSISKISDYPKAKYYLTYEGDEFDHNTFRLLCRKHKGQQIYGGVSNLMNRLHLDFNDDRVWKFPLHCPINPKYEDVQWIINYIAEYKRNKNILWGDPSDFDIKFKLNYFLKVIKIFRNLFNNKLLSGELSYRSIKLYIYRFLRKITIRKFYTKDYKSLLSQDEYIYFPLHHPLDSQLTLRGKPFMDQSAIISIVARYVPFPYKLIIKEHPHAQGFFKYTDIKKLSKISNVKILHPLINSHEIIPNALAIVVINSSVGYESILYKKPVITLGKSFYRNQGLTSDIDSLYELEKAFSDVKYRNITDEQVVDFIWRLQYYTYDVDAMRVLKNDIETSTNLAAALYKFLNKNDV